MADKKRDAEQEPRSKHTIVAPDDLWLRLRVAALEDGRDVSEIVCELAEQFLKTRKGGRR